MTTRTIVGVEEPEGPREGLEAVVALRRLLEASQVEEAVVAGWTWAEIAEVLG